MDSYRTLRTEDSDSFIVKKSRFIGYASPAPTEEQALAFLAKIRDRHKDASHNCYAYIVGKNEGIMRYSDDGEPGGTAGMPILEVIRAQHVVDCCVVVTRYFGGVLLGAGGLVRAYAEGSKIALLAAGVITMENSVRFWAGVDYALWGRLEHYLKSAPVRLEGADYGATVTATLLVRRRDAEAVFDAIEQLSDGQAELMEVENLFEGWADDAV